MTNEDVAAILEEMADLLELADDNSFKVRSYRRAAETIKGLGEDLAGIHARGELETVPGIGKSLAERIAEYLETGEISYRRALQARFPETILTLLRIPGFGPKKVGLVYRELGIGSVEELEQAARAHRLRDLKGMGAKSEENILKGIALYREGLTRTLLGVALPLAEVLVEELRSQPEVIAAEMAGSVRRRRETIGDLDLLATSETAATVCAAFAKGKDVIVAGDTKVSVAMSSGIKADLRCVPPESYGAALLYFTGSKQHNIDLRERAQKRGLTLNEYGLFEETEGEKGRLVAGRSEEEIYAALGLAWIPPELRESRGELEAAEKGSLPELLELGQVRADLQMHTIGSDGRNSLEEMARACIERGYQYMAVTDHSPALGVAGGQSGDQLQAQVEEVHKLNERLAEEGHEFRVLAGLEADILGDGRLDIPAGLYEELDLVLGSIHQGFSADADRITGRVLTAMESGQMDVFAHPTGRLLLGREAYGIHLEPVIEAAVHHRIALEINASPQR
ncbi:DNA polymerase/3'-5' exonuclease PolX, partial [bacterium]|nr:DNA polymerase/3'-5' exonuclease PolX [bacterium]